MKAKEEERKRKEEAPEILGGEHDDAERPNMLVFPIP